MNPIIPPNRICGQRVAKKTGEPCRVSWTRGPTDHGVDQSSMPGQWTDWHGCRYLDTV